jgi:carbamoyl-phosphate synthase large subunit
MKSVGEVMAIGRTFKESVQKALCSLETGLSGFDSVGGDDEFIRHEIRRPNAERILYLAEGFRRGFSLDDIFEMSKVDPWFLYQLEEIVAKEKTITKEILSDKEAFRAIKADGFSDKKIAELINKNSQITITENYVYNARKELGSILSTMKLIHVPQNLKH